MLMAATLQNLKDAAVELLPGERAELARFLLESVEPVEDSWAEAWEKGLDRRYEEMQSGRVKGVPASEVLARMRERYP